MILFIKHIDIEGPGTIETYLDNQCYDLETVDLGKGEALPDNFSDLEAVVCLGGPMNVYEEDKYPFLKKENEFIKEILKREIPYLGICLGSQLLAKACGAKVVKSPVKEVGWFTIDFKKETQKDLLFASLKGPFDVFHWHEDMWEIPPGGTLLATAQGCPHQAFKVGKNAYGIQFHVEVTGRIIEDWCKAYLKSSDPTKQKQAQDMINIFNEKQRAFKAQAEIVYKNFETIISRRSVRV